MKFLKKFQRNVNGVTPVAGVILLLALTIALASIVLKFGLGAADIKKPPDLYFTYVEAKTSGWIYATAVGSTKIGAGDLKFFVDDQPILPDATNFVIDGQPYAEGVNDRVSGGNKIALKAASRYASGQKVSILIVHIPTGSLLSEASVEARAD